MLRPGSAFLVLQFLVPQLSAGCLHASGQGQLEEMGTVQACSWMTLGCCFGVLCYGRRPAVASNCPRCSSSLLAAHQPRPPALLHCRRSSRRRALARVTSWSRHGSSTLARRRVRWGRCNSSRGRRRQTVNEKVLQCHPLDPVDHAMLHRIRSWLVMQLHASGAGTTRLNGPACNNNQLACTCEHSEPSIPGQGPRCGLGHLALAHGESASVLAALELIP